MNPDSEQASSSRSFSGQARTWTTRQLLEWMTPYFQERGIDSARLIAEILLGHVLGCERLRLYMEVDRPASPMELATLRALVARVGRHEPVQYVLGEWEFRGRAFQVGPGALIPRPATECVVEAVVELLADRAGGASPLLLADIGTGSGVIAVSLALELRESRVIATDVSEDALAIARTNAAVHDMNDAIAFRSGSHFDPLGKDEAFDCIVANPPYISDDEWQDVARNVRDYEPVTALRGGTDGLDHLRVLIGQAHEYLKPGGFAVFEIAASQGETVLDLAMANSNLVDPRVEQDHEEHPRIFIAQRSD